VIDTDIDTKRDQKINMMTRLIQICEKIKKKNGRVSKYSGLSLVGIDKARDLWDIEPF
jgi:hypothetical protein